MGTLFKRSYTCAVLESVVRCKEGGLMRGGKVGCFLFLNWVEGNTEVTKEPSSR